jgi:hypothetical protein
MAFPLPDRVEVPFMSELREGVVDMPPTLPWMGVVNVPVVDGAIGCCMPEFEGEFMEPEEGDGVVLCA